MALVVMLAVAPARAAETDADRAERWKALREAVFRERAVSPGDLFEPIPRKIGPRADRTEVVVDLRHVLFSPRSRFAGTLTRC